MAIDQEMKDRLNKLHRESKALLESLADRLPPDGLQQLRTFSFVGEWSLLVDGMCASLVKRQTPITPSERDALAVVLAYCRYLKDRDETLTSLNVVGE